MERKKTNMVQLCVLRICSFLLQTQKEKRVTNMSPQQQIFICMFGDKMNSEHSTSQMNSSRIEMNKQDNTFLYYTFVTSGSWDLCSEKNKKVESGSKGGEGVSFSAWTSSNISLQEITANRPKWKRKRRMSLK